MKKISVILALILVLALPLGALAAHPDSIASGEEGSTTGLVVIRKPETVNSATTRSVYGVTGVGSAGVSVAIYRYNGASYVPITNADGSRVVTTIGAAGIFYKQVSLSEGHNLFAVRAENAAGQSQIVYFDLNRLSQELIDNISESGNMQTIFNGWLN